MILTTVAYSKCLSTAHELRMSATLYISPCTRSLNRNKTYISIIKLIFRYDKGNSVKE